jgi:hypothetical protein
LTIALWIGSAVGAVLGLFHAGYVYRQHLSDSANAPAGISFAARLRAGYYAVWTLGLWILFGSYVLYLWVLGCILYLLYKAVPKSRAA